MIGEMAYSIDTFEEYTIDDHGTLTCADVRAAFCGNFPENIVGAVSHGEQPFAFRVRKSGLNG